MIVPQENDVEMQHQFGTFFNFFVFGNTFFKNFIKNYLFF